MLNTRLKNNYNFWKFFWLLLSHARTNCQPVTNCYRILSVLYVKNLLLHNAHAHAQCAFLICFRTLTIYTLTFCYQMLSVRFTEF